MADFKHDNNKGSIFKNDQKGNDKAPSYKGTINVEGKDFSISLWVNEIKKGENQGQKYFGVQIEEPYNKEANNTKANEVAAAVIEPTDDLPF